ncbi:MAG: DUF2155 domain-containing protein [Xanthobacteraceae bacterium]
MVRSAALLLVIAAILAASPAVAQFGSFFGDAPPRPPADVPNGPFPQQPPPAEYPSQAPPSAYPSYPTQAPPSYPGAAAPAYPAATPPTAIEAQPLPPPPGAAVGPVVRPGSGVPQRPSAPTQPAVAAPPANPSSSAPASSAAAPSPDDIVIERPTAHIENGRAEFAGLDKITGRTYTFDAAIGETVQFGALRVTPRACYTRPPTEATNTDAFVEVDEVTLKREIKRIFTGWMFASSPGLDAVDHPVYDVWLTDCSSPLETSLAEPAPQPASASARTRHPVRPRPRPSAEPDAGLQSR